MALRIGQPEAAGYPAVLPEEELTTEQLPELPMEEPDALAPMDSGSVVEWLQEALDICKSYECPEELAYALEQALTMLIGPSAVSATEPAPPMEEPLEETEAPEDAV